MSRRGLNIMGDILGTNLICTLSAVVHKLNVSGHNLVWIFSRLDTLNGCPKSVLIFQLHCVYKIHVFRVDAESLLRFFLFLGYGIVLSGRWVPTFQSNLLLQS